MKGLRFLLLGLVLCLANGVKAQFYDSADDIYYYVSCDESGKPYENGYTVVFNFDGNKACDLAGYLQLKLDPLTGMKEDKTRVDDIKRIIQSNQSYFDDKVENTEYTLRYVSGNTYTGTGYLQSTNMMGYMCWQKEIHEFNFSNNRETMVDNVEMEFGSMNSRTIRRSDKVSFKRVEKSFFKVGRSRTPSGTLHE